jgi:hypothetical protein
LTFPSINSELVNGNVVFDSTSGTGTVFTIKASDNGKSTLPGKMSFKVDRTVVKMLTKCSIPIRIGDEYGPLRVVGFTTTGDKKAKSSCGWDHAARAAEINRMTAARTTADKAMALTSDGGDGDDEDNNDSAAIALGVVGAALVVVVAVGAAYFLRRPAQHQLAAPPIAFEVDLDSQKIHQVDSSENGQPQN